MPADTVFSLILGPDIHRVLRGETYSERMPRRLSVGLASKYKIQFLTLRYLAVSAAGFFILSSTVFKSAQIQYLPSIYL
jgi:hypothetical protein